MAGHVGVPSQALTTAALFTRINPVCLIVCRGALDQIHLLKCLGLIHNRRKQFRQKEGSLEVDRSSNVNLDPSFLK